MEPWREWAITSGTQPRTICRRFGGTFDNALIEAFVHADVVNMEKILDTWPEIFKRLYKINQGG